MEAMNFCKIGLVTTGSLPSSYQSDYEARDKDIVVEGYATGTWSTNVFYGPLGAFSFRRVDHMNNEDLAVPMFRSSVERLRSEEEQIETLETELGRARERAIADGTAPSREQKQKWLVVVKENSSTDDSARLTSDLPCRASAEDAS